VGSKFIERDWGEGWDRNSLRDNLGRGMGSNHSSIGGMEHILYGLGQERR
jgi:hypothetical protein